MFKFIKNKLGKIHSPLSAETKKVLVRGAGEGFIFGALFVPLMSIGVAGVSMPVLIAMAATSFVVGIAAIVAASRIKDNSKGGGTTAVLPASTVAGNSTPALQVKPPAADFTNAVKSKGATVAKTATPAPKPVDQPKI